MWLVSSAFFFCFFFCGCQSSWPTVTFFWVVESLLEEARRTAERQVTPARQNCDDDVVCVRVVCQKIT